MSRYSRLPILVLAVLVAAVSSARTQAQYIDHVYPAGGQQGTTFPVRFGGQGLADITDLVVTGEGVSVRLVDFCQGMEKYELMFLRQQITELQRKETVISEELVKKMNSMEFPEPIGPDRGPGAVPYISCPACGTANAIDAVACVKCRGKVERPKAPAPTTTPGEKDAKGSPPKSEMELAKARMIERIEMRLTDAEPVFAEVAISPDATPGRREIRVVTRRGVSNALPFYVGQAPEVSRKSVGRTGRPVLGKESQAQRRRPRDEEEVRVAPPCTMNGQLAPGEVNRYRFQAAKGQRLVISVNARNLIPYVPDGVPGWCQAVLRLYDASGRELAYNDDYKFSPDPLIYFEVPEDGEYLLAINEALYRGNESFVYRITIGEMPYITGVFPLGGRVGEPIKVELDGWNLEKATPIVPPADAKPGRHRVAATVGSLVSNDVAFDLDTLPERLSSGSAEDASTAQKVEMPVIVNGRIERPGDWHIFEVEGKAGETIVAEVVARRLGSPLDSFVKVTGADGRIVAFNDDHFDAASGLNTDHADSYLMVKMPEDGKYFIHLGDTRQHAGKTYAYRLRISRPVPDFMLRIAPSRLNLTRRAPATATVFAIRKDGFDGPISLSVKDLPKGFEASKTTISGKQESVPFTLKATLAAMEKPVYLSVVGTAKIAGREVEREVMPAEDRMQAFLWRHLLLAETLPAFVGDPGYQRPAERTRPPIRDEDRPKGVRRTAIRRAVEPNLRRIEDLYQDWLLTEEFTNREIAKLEATVIQ